MKHLYQKIYLTIIGSLLLLVLLAALLWKFTSDNSYMKHTYEIASNLASELLPPKTDTIENHKIKITELSEKFKIDIALLDQQQKLIASSSPKLQNIKTDRIKVGWIHIRRGHHAWAVKLPDQRWVIVRPKRQHFRGPPFGGVTIVALIALAIAIGIYPAVRGLTKRLEHLQKGVENLGAGDLSARVEVKGKDEIARLATSFNQSAERIEQLMQAHRTLLANASHELRTPLSRLRVGIELLKHDSDPKRKSELETDISELDQLIDEILLASRLNNIKELETTEEIDLLALVAEEVAKYPEYSLDGQPIIFKGDERLIRRLIRNLLENALRYGSPPVTVNLKNQNKAILLEVIDSGDGLSADEYEKIFDPFYRPKGQTENKGFGLGLSIVKQIAGTHGGDVEFTSTHEQKSCFRVTLPTDYINSSNDTQS